jgi:hypothetical protein
MASFEMSPVVEPPITVSDRLLYGPLYVGSECIHFVLPLTSRPDTLPIGKLLCPPSALPSLGM